VVGGTPYTDQLEAIARSASRSSRRPACRSFRRRNSLLRRSHRLPSRANPNRYVITAEREAQNLKQLLFVGEDEAAKT